MVDPGLQVVLPHLLEPGIQHVLHAGTHHHKITVARLHAQQRIAHGTANKIDAGGGREKGHGVMMPDYIGSETSNVPSVVILFVLVAHGE